LPGRDVTANIIIIIIITTTITTTIIIIIIITTTITTIIIIIWKQADAAYMLYMSAAAKAHGLGCVWG
jgi:hypothetical protein